MDMETRKMNFEISGAGVSLNSNRNLIILTSRNGKPKKPSEIPQPGKDPETVPSEEPEPATWPKKEPEITPGEEPLTTPPGAPPEIPAPPQGPMTSNLPNDIFVVKK
jgi:hypothetical protein